MQPSAFSWRDASERVVERLAGDVARGDAAHDRLGTSGRVRTTRLLRGFIGSVAWIDGRLERLLASMSSREARAKHQTSTSRAPAVEQAARALPRGRAGGRDVVDEQDARGRRAARAESAAHVLRAARERAGRSDSRSRGP